MLQRIQNLWDDFNTWVAIIATQLEEEQDHKSLPLLDETPQYLDTYEEDFYDSDSLSDADFDEEYPEHLDFCEDDMIDYN